MEEKGGRLTVPFLDRAFQLALRLFFFDCVTLIKGLLALCKADQDFGLAADKVNLKGNEGKTLRCYLADKLTNLFFMKQKLARAQRFVVHDIAVGIGADIRVEEEDLVVLYNGVAIDEVGEAEAQGFYLGTLKRDTRFECILDKVIVVGLAICRDRGICLMLCHNTGLLPCIPLSKGMKQ
jgi:hypothetical protein